MELLSGRGEVRSGRGGVRSGRAVVGVDVVSQTLPRNYRAPSQHHCCPPGPRPSVRCDMSSDSRCAGCMSDSSLEDQTRPCPPLPPYPPHRYHREEWVDPEMDCATCRLQAQPPCACSDPLLPWGADLVTHPVLVGAARNHAKPDFPPGLSSLPPTTPDGRQSVLPKLLSIEERLTTALGRPLDPQSRSQPHVDTHAHAHASQTYTHSTTQAHVHAKCETTPNTHAQHQHLNPNNSHHHHHHKGQSAPDPHSLGVHRDGGTGSRLSRSMENLPRDIQDHILRCQCSCDHLGYGNFSNRHGGGGFTVERAWQTNWMVWVVGIVRETRLCVGHVLLLLGTMQRREMDEAHRGNVPRLTACLIQPPLRSILSSYLRGGGRDVRRTTCR
ncbi:hypothetical protein O3P69_005864 [Scylla paramamosain]|uniref:Uncharacterized protein n=1 Tax=Scylla paramamosain TaxID=85552 RepID=A0AAW0U3N6_SCYPA